MKKILLLSVIFISMTLNASTFQISKDACTNGQARGCTILGLIYVVGKEIKRDFAKGIKYLNEGCDLGDMEGCQMLGIMYANGTGVKKDLSISREYFDKLSDFIKNKKSNKERDD